METIKIKKIFFKKNGKIESMDNKLHLLEKFTLDDNVGDGIIISQSGLDLSERELVNVNGEINVGVGRTWGLAFYWQVGIV